MKERHVCEQGCGALAQGTAVVSPALGQRLGLSSGLRPLMLWQQPPSLCCSWAACWAGLGCKPTLRTSPVTTLTLRAAVWLLGRGVTVPHQLGLVICSREVLKVLGGPGDPP